MTPYVLEFVVALLAVVGAALVIREYWRRGDWLLVRFFVVFGLAPFWFTVAQFRTIAWGDPGWLFNRWISFWVRLPLVFGLYVVAWRLHVKNGRRR